MHGGKVQHPCPGNAGNHPPFGELIFGHGGFSRRWAVPRLPLAMRFDMRFSLPVLFWLTFAVALVAAVAGASGVSVVAVAIIGLYLFAPLWLTLFSSFAQGIRPESRLHIAYGIILVLALSTLLISLPFMLQAFYNDEPAWGLGFAVVIITILGLWSAQIDIMRHVHNQQSEARRQQLTKRQRSAAPNRLDGESTSHDLTS